MKARWARCDWTLVDWQTGQLMTNQPIKKPHPPVKGDGANFNKILNEVELLATTENQSKSTEAKKGCGGRLRNGIKEFSSDDESTGAAVSFDSSSFTEGLRRSIQRRWSG